MCDALDVLGNENELCNDRVGRLQDQGPVVCIGGRRMARYIIREYMIATEVAEAI